MYVILTYMSKVASVILQRVKQTEIHFVNIAKNDGES